MQIKKYMLFMCLSFSNFSLVALKFEKITTLSIDCVYTKVSDGVQIKTENFKLHFLFDEKTLKSYVIGNQGSAEVQMLLKKEDGGMTFVETTATNNIMVTAIGKNGESVHSRQTIMFGDLIPSQYYGKCVVK